MDRVGECVGQRNDAKATAMSIYFSSSPLFLVSAVNRDWAPDDKMLM